MSVPSQHKDGAPLSSAGGQHNDAAKALLGLNTAVNLPLKMESPLVAKPVLNGQSALLRTDMFPATSQNTAASHQEQMQNVTVHPIVTSPSTAHSSDLGAFREIAIPSSAATIMPNGPVSRPVITMPNNLQNIVSSINPNQSAPQEPAKTQRKKRKRGGTKGQQNETAQSGFPMMTRGGGGGSTFSLESALENQVFQGWPLPPTLPQFQNPNAAAHFVTPNMTPVNFFVSPALGQTFTNADASLAIANRALLAGNGIFPNPTFGASNAAQNMLQSVMSQFAMGVGGALFAGVPHVGAASNNPLSQLAVSHLSPMSGGGKPPRPTEMNKEHENGAKKGGKDDKSESKSGGRKQRYYKSLSCNYWNSMEDQDNEEGGSDDGNMDITTPWRCEVCNIYFTSAQALGGHRINSTDHKQRCEKLRRGDTASLPGTPRLSLHVYSNEETAEKGKRTRLPPMAQMAGFDRVLLGFPSDVRMALARIQSPAAYFSSCSLEVFKRHDKFGNLGKKGGEPVVISFPGFIADT